MSFAAVNILIGIVTAFVAGVIGCVSGARPTGNIGFKILWLLGGFIACYFFWTLLVLVFLIWAGAGAPGVEMPEGLLTLIADTGWIAVFWLSAVYGIYKGHLREGNVQ